MIYKKFEFGSCLNFKKCCDWLNNKQIHYFKHSHYTTIIVFCDELDLLNENEVNEFFNEILE